MCVIVRLVFAVVVTPGPQVRVCNGLFSFK